MCTEGTEELAGRSCLEIDESRGSLTVPATVEHLDDVFDLIHAELQRRGCPVAASYQLDIAVEELFVNICSYAYAGSDEPGLARIDYVCVVEDSAITVSLTDWGAPFDPLAHDDPERPRSIDEARIGGLGIFLVKRLVDDLHYKRDGDANVVTLKKTWKPRGTRPKPPEHERVSNGIIDDEEH